MTTANIYPRYLIYPQKLRFKFNIAFLPNIQQAVHQRYISTALECRVLLKTQVKLLCFETISIYTRHPLQAICEAIVLNPSCIRWQHNSLPRIKPGTTRLRCFCLLNCSLSWEKVKYVFEKRLTIVKIYYGVLCPRFIFAMQCNKHGRICFGFVGDTKTSQFFVFDLCIWYLELVSVFSGTLYSVDNTI